MGQKVIVQGLRYRCSSITHKVSIHDARCSLYSEFGVIKAGVRVGAKGGKEKQKKIVVRMEPGKLS